MDSDKPETKEINPGLFSRAVSVELKNQILSASATRVTLMKHARNSSILT